MIDVDPARFEDLVVTALDGLPEEFGHRMQNVAVTVQHDAGPPGLLGLYEGVPLTSRTCLMDHLAAAHPADALPRASSRGPRRGAGAGPAPIAAIMTTARNRSE